MKNYIRPLADRGHARLAGADPAAAYRPTDFGTGVSRGDRGSGH
jgi:hypothetical protein